MKITDEMVERLKRLSKVGFGYDIKDEDRAAINAAVAALSAAPAVGVKVKALEWNEPASNPEDRDGTNFVSYSIAGTYTVWFDKTVVRTPWNTSAPGVRHCTKYRSKKSAKAAAQSDYEARILSALELSAAKSQREEDIAGLKQLAANVGMKFIPFSEGKDNG